MRHNDISRADDYLVVVKRTRLQETSRGTILHGGNNLSPLPRHLAEAIRAELLQRESMREYNVWVIHREDF